MAKRRMHSVEALMAGTVTATDTSHLIDYIKHACPHELERSVVKVFERMLIRNSKHTLDTLRLIVSHKIRLPQNAIWMACKEAFLSGEESAQVMEVLSHLLKEGMPKNEVISAYATARAVQCWKVAALLEAHLNREAQLQARRIHAQLANNDISKKQRRM